MFWRKICHPTWLVADYTLFVSHAYHNRCRPLVYYTITQIVVLVRTMVLICVGVSTKTMDCINWKLTSELPFVAVSKWGLVRSLSYGISFIHTQISVHLHVNKTNFRMKGFTPGLALRRRWKATRKLPIILMGRKETWRKSFPISLGLLLCGFRANKSVIIPCGILT